MKLDANLKQVSQPSSRQRQFLIKYTENMSIPSKTKDKRYCSNHDSDLINHPTSTQTPYYKVQEPIRNLRKTEESKTQRYHQKNNSLMMANILFGSMMSDREENKHLNDLQSVSKKQEKKLPRIPIEYNDEKIYGILADLQRIKVVYRGYSPKNTYFFFKKLTSKTQLVDIQSKPRSDFELEFDSKFQSGNLSAAARKSQREYWLYMRQDTNTFGMRQWYYFLIFNRKIGTFKFRIYRFTKSHSLYKQGMKPFVKDGAINHQWSQRGNNIKYEYDFQLKCYYLEFEYEFTKKYTTTQFAAQPPYTYSMLKQYLQQLSLKYPTIKLQQAGNSLAGLEIPKITIKGRQKNKQAIILIARTHPGETASNYALESLIQRIFQLKNLKSAFDFFLIPMVNPDGVFFGNHRTGVLGQDINRNFNNKDAEYFPQVKAVQNLIQDVRQSHQIAFLFDLHGHSAKKNIFAFGQQSTIGSLPYLQSRIIPKILSNILSTFKFESCLFKGSKQKKNSARVFLGKKYKITTLTFEESYGLINEGSIGIRQWKNFGIAIADALQEYVEVCGKGEPCKMQEYLSETIKDDMDKQQQKKMKPPRADSIEKNQQPKLLTENKTEYIKEQNTNETVSIPLQCRDIQLDHLKPNIIKENFSQVSSSELSSGEDQLQNNQQGLQKLKRQIAKIGCFKERVKRQKYNVISKEIQIRDNYQPRLHEQRSSMIPRILKYQMKKKQEEKQVDALYNFYKQSKKNQSKKKRSQRTKRDSIEFPYLKR